MFFNALTFLIFLSIVAIVKKGAHIQPLLEYYESTDVPSLTRKIRSIAAFKGIGSPITADGTIDYQSRYIQADICIALAYIVALAKKVGVAAPGIDKLVSDVTAIMTDMS